MNILSRWAALRVGVVLGASALLLSGCSGTEATTTTSAETDPEIVEQSRLAVEAAYEAASAVPPSDGPPAAEDVRLFFVTALGSATGARSAKVVEEVTEKLGWDVRIFDSKFDPDTQQEGMRQAISWGADAILLFGMDCPGNESPLQQLREAGITIVAFSSVDCSEVDAGAESMFDGVPSYPGASTPRENFLRRGAAQADWVIANSGGTAQVIELPVPDFRETAAFQEGFETRLAECAGCEIVEVIPIGVEDFGPEIQDKTVQALVRYPSADYIVAAYDELINYGVASAVMNSDRSDEIQVVAGNGDPANMELVRNGEGQHAGFGYDVDWEVFASIDVVSRLMQGEAPGVVGPPIVLFDTEHNVPETGGYKSLGDFRSVFYSIWLDGR
ncbi:substrate-binding domain-containing protein [Salinibacterium sp. ZJ450]|uniref:sugar ABC transporter substrate-binding protein n=1 Tax=Salinibacterium sp. ZJ450 TaxID=2708338 RepID=UPI0014224DCC|nr:substrate-binding domain-containing protein [Salinibacterium sp. ZJ450]